MKSTTSSWAVRGQLSRVLLKGGRSEIGINQNMDIYFPNFD
jgi:hypothetical protein